MPKKYKVKVSAEVILELDDETIQEMEEDGDFRIVSDWESQVQDGLAFGFEVRHINVRNVIADEYEEVQ